MLHFGIAQINKGNAMTTFKTSGVCSRSISFTLAADSTVHDVIFEGGCNGNAQGLSRLVEGQPAEEVISRLAGIRCDGKQSSCPDQLSRALRQKLETMQNIK